MFRRLVTLVLAATAMLLPTTVQAFPGPSARTASTALASAPGGPAAVLPLGPGIQMITKGRRCTAGFVFRDARKRVFLGYAARCAVRRAVNRKAACLTPTRRLGTRVRFTTGVSGSHRGHTVGWGTLRYSSWRAMRRAGVRGGALCAHNDFALVQVDRRLRRKVNPSVPFWGGPVALGSAPAAGAHVFGVGRPGRTPALSPMVGDALGASRLRFFAPVLPRDVGGPLLGPTGRAVGQLSGGRTADSLPVAVRFARGHGVRGLVLVPGRARFTSTAVF